MRVKKGVVYDHTKVNVEKTILTTSAVLMHFHAPDFLEKIKILN